MYGKDIKRIKKHKRQTPLKMVSPVYLTIIKIFCVLGLLAGCISFIYDFILLGIILKGEDVWIAFIESITLIVISGFILRFALRMKSEKNRYYLWNDLYIPPDQ